MLRHKPTKAANTAAICDVIKRHCVSTNHKAVTRHIHGVRAKSPFPPLGTKLLRYGNRRFGPRTGFRPAYRLLAVSLRDLPDELGPGHVDGAVDGPCLGARIAFE